MAERITLPDRPSSPLELERWAIEVRGMLRDADGEDLATMLAELRGVGLLGIRREYQRAGHRLRELLDVAGRCGLLPPVGEEFRLTARRWLAFGELIDTAEAAGVRGDRVEGGVR